MMKHLAVVAVAGGLLQAWPCMAADAAAPVAQAAALPVVVVKPAATQAQASYEGQVEAVRQTVLAAQVPGSIVAITVKAGERVSAGQVLVRLDGRAAAQATVASDAQREVAAKDLERKRQLYAKQYISKAALEQAEAAYKAAAAQTTAAQTQSGLHVLRAPYAGVVTQVSAEQGDMAMPGKPLLTVYDPAAMRVTAAIPTAVLSGMANVPVVAVEIPDLGAAAQKVTPASVQVLPVVDGQSMTRQLRAGLPPLQGVVPGLFARVWLSAVAQGDGATNQKASTIAIPLKAVVRRAEMTGVYVLSAKGQPLLRQVRLGPVRGDQVEVLGGIDAGDKVVTDPQTAVRLTQPQTSAQ